MTGPLPIPCDRPPLPSPVPRLRRRPLSSVTLQPRETDLARQTEHRCPRCGQQRKPSMAAQRRPQLSPREVEVLCIWLRGRSKSNAGETLYITASTVKTHIQRIRDKYDEVGRPAPTKLSLAIRAIQDGLIDIDDL